MTQTLIVFPTSLRNISDVYAFYRQNISIIYPEFDQICSTITHLQETQNCTTEMLLGKKKKGEERSCGLKKYSEEFFFKELIHGAYIFFRIITS